VLAASSFIGDTKRAELFEITDNEVPVIRITLPEKDYEDLKAVARKGYCFYKKDGTGIPFNTKIGFFEFTPADWATVDWTDNSYDPYDQLPYETKNAVMTFEVNGYEYIYIYIYIFLFNCIHVINLNFYNLLLMNNLYLLHLLIISFCYIYIFIDK